MKVLYVMRGVPGSGKSVASRLIVPKEQIFSTDDFWGPEYNFDYNKLGEAHCWNQGRTRDAMEKGVSPIAVDNTNVIRKEIKPYTKLAKEYGYEVVYKESAHPKWLEAAEVIKQYNKDRQNPMFIEKLNILTDFFFGNNKHNVPKEVIFKMLRKWVLTEELEMNKQIENWDELVSKNNLLRIGKELCNEIEKLQPDGEALIVGGSVRDLLLEKEIHDVDLATNVSIDILSKRFKTVDIGKSRDFGIVNISYKGVDFQVAQFRSETGSLDLRHPESVTKVSSFKIDSARRDITINSLGITKDGEVIDYQNGLEDLKNKIIRTVGKPQDRFMEDALRIMRVCRFASNFKFVIDPETEQAMKELVHLVDSLSKERIQEELYKVAVDGQNFATYIQYIDRIGLLERILPEIKDLQKFPHSPEHHPEGLTVFEHVLAALRVSRSNDPVVNLSTAFHDLGKSKTHGMKNDKHTYYGHDYISAKIIAYIGTRLKFKTRDIEAMQFAAENHMRVHHIDEMRQSKVAVLVNSPYWNILKDVTYADELCRLGVGDIEAFNQKVHNAEQKTKEVSANTGSEGLRLRLKNFIDGTKLMQWIPELNEKQNKPFIGNIMRGVHEWIIDNNLFNATEEQVKQYAINLFTNINK